MQDSTVKPLIEGALALGFGLSAVLQQRTGKTLEVLAQELGCRRSELSMCLLGYPGRTYPRVRDALAQMLGASRADVDRWIHQTAERRKVVAA